MRTNRHIFSTILLWAITAVVLGCANPPEPMPPPAYVPSISMLEPEDYPGEIDKYRKLIQSGLHLDIQQRAHLYLASLRKQQRLYPGRLLPILLSQPVRRKGRR